MMTLPLFSYCFLLHLVFATIIPSRRMSPKPFYLASAHHVFFPFYIWIIVIIGAIMIRLPPTAILLGRCDLKEFDRRQKLRDIESETETVKQEFARFEVGDHDGPSFACQKKPRTTPTENETHNKYDRDESSSHIRPLTLQIAGSSGLDSQSRDEPSPSILPTPDNEETTAAHPSVDEHNYVSIEVDGSSENVAVKIERASSPSKDDFYFGGFTESPMQRTTDNTPRSLSFGIAILSLEF